MKLIIAALAVAAAVLLAACGSPAAAHAPHAATAATATPAAAATKQAATADPCTAEISWRDGGGQAMLTKVVRKLAAVAGDETNGRVAALQRDGTALYAAAVAAAAAPPPIDRAHYEKVMRLAEKSTVDVQAGDYQAGITAITEAGDLTSVMTADITSRCG